MKRRPASFTGIVIRAVLLVGVALAIAVIAPLFRWLGLQELALVLAFFVLVVAVESVRFIICQGVRGYRGGREANSQARRQRRG